MKETKVRRKGFLALLLAAILVLGIPGMDVTASSYHADSVNPGLILRSGDSIYTTRVVSSGDLVVFIGTSKQDPKLVFDYAFESSMRVIIPYGDWLVTDVDISGADNYIYVSHYTFIEDSSPAEGYYRSLRELISAIYIDGGDSHYYETGTALPYSVMKALENNPDDTLVFKCEYKGNRYTFTIHGADVKGKISPEIPWYGPYWLAQNFFSTTVIEPLEPVIPAQ